MRCLIVDDDELGRMMLEVFMEEFGTCDTAENGKVAIDLYEKAATEGNPYDLICLDIIMPVMDGRATLHNLREMEKLRGLRSKVFMISACNTPKDIEDAFFEGDCDDYVVKPFQRELISQMLERHKLI
jgi:two-component system chemotaxis response regulator CheY